MKIATKLVVHRKSRERGSTMVEFALTFLPLLALLMLTVDLGWLIFAWASIHEGVREGVRIAITGQSDSTIRAVVKKYSFGFLKDPPAGGTDPVQIYYYSQSDLANAVSGIGTTCSGQVVKIVVSGVSVSPMAALWRSNSPLVLTAAAADVVEQNSSCR